MPWYAILTNLFLRGMIPPACSKGVRKLSPLSILPHQSYRIFYLFGTAQFVASSRHLDYFKGIGTWLAAVLEVGLTVKRYVYVDNSQVSTRVARHHLHQLMVLYPYQLYPTTIHGCFSRLPHDVTLISAADLCHLGPVDMVIAGWPCKGHSRARAHRRLDNPRSSLFWDFICLMQWW